MDPADLKSRPSADELYTQAIKQLGFDNPPPAILRLLAQGLKALREADAAPLNERELQAIENIISYVSLFEKVDEATVEAIVTAMFNVKDVKDIPSGHYEDAVCFLMEVDFTHLVN